MERERIGREERERLRREQELESANAELETVAEPITEVNGTKDVEMGDPPPPVAPVPPETLTTENMAMFNLANPGDRVRTRGKGRKGDRARRGQEDDGEEYNRFSGTGHVLGKGDEVEGGEDV